MSSMNSPRTAIISETKCTSPAFACAQPRDTRMGRNMRSLYDACALYTVERTSKRRALDILDLHAPPTHPRGMHGEGQVERV